jgi:catechol 2,3-dioxygenase-like lactoylglutathione lyase family enzyme
MKAMHQGFARVNTYSGREKKSLRFRPARARIRAMAALGFNHVSINAINLDESVRFYEDLLGMEKIPTYDFAFPTQYMRLGALQLHIFERPATAPEFHHIAITVDDLESVYLRAKEIGALDSEAFFSPIYELPDGGVQLYLRDPAGNLVELDWPDVDTLDRSVFDELPKLADAVPQSAEGLESTLFLP